MRSSRFGIIVLIALAVLVTTNCSYYNRIMSRKNLVDGSTAYRDRKFETAEDLFRRAAERDPEGETLEGRTAQLFLARTLHQRYSANRSEKSLAERALVEYNKAIPQSLREYAAAKTAYEADPTSQAETKRYFSALSAVNNTSSAIASLNNALEQQAAAKEWQQRVAGDESFPDTARVRAIVALGLEYNTCANDITNNEKVRKTVKRDGKDVYQYVKPENPEDMTKLTNCISEGEKLFNQAYQLESDFVKNAANTNVKSLTDDQLSLLEERILPFESARSYRASMAAQAARLAEMEGRADLAAVRAEADRRKQESDELKTLVGNIKAEKDARIAAAQAAALEAVSGNANAAK
ncbi:hypothetical protein [Leptolyngbya sp. 7M]|uniref:hypothetical protein n=1 Tax=Leptolyngbya sp. 7M TaxID=2812896 RepID=UPI001B8CE005|nr:hypothetical protein [Leptolyngbya sp. 7M]QYO66441.1 hypothetical protein JVX88_06470 [Leptolyngbya sp. 7M]